MSDVPEKPMPTDPATVRHLTDQMDQWWRDLTPGQKMTVYIAAEPV